MRDRFWIIAGLLVFLAIATAPFWSMHLSARKLTSGPNLTLPATEKACVAPAALMRRSHMQMLVNWREDVVRHGDRSYTAWNGKVYEKSLTHTCLGCHNKQEFCDRCHTYAGVAEPYCWKCHSQPRTEIARSTP